MKIYRFALTICALLLCISCSKPKWSYTLDYMLKRRYWLGELQLGRSFDHKVKSAVKENMKLYGNVAVYVESPSYATIWSMVEDKNYNYIVITEISKGKPNKNLYLHYPNSIGWVTDSNLSQAKDYLFWGGYGYLDGPTFEFYRSKQYSKGNDNNVITGLPYHQIINPRINVDTISNDFVREMSKVYLKYIVPIYDQLYQQIKEEKKEQSK